MKKILVIEDEQLLLKNILSILKAEGFEAIGASGGSRGVEMATSETPDLIICDVMMPELDGYGVLKQLQQNPETHLIPFIFLTAKSDRADIRQGIELGADDYLTKPFDIEELLRAIEARFKKQEAFYGRMQSLSEELDKLQQFVSAKDEMFSNLTQELRQPVSNINMALKMLENEQPPEAKERYLKILQEEFTREISLLNQVAEAQKLLTPENVSLLRQFGMLK
ncbi:MAG: response regulator [Cyanobacteriota bacterium]|nr:response regulator [Cyanobacteriota bacterium]